MNWRKPIIYALLYASGSRIPQNLKEIKKVGKFSEKEKTKEKDLILKKGNISRKMAEKMKWGNIAREYYKYYD